MRSGREGAFRSEIEVASLIESSIGLDDEIGLDELVEMIRDVAIETCKSKPRISVTTGMQHAA